MNGLVCSSESGANRLPNEFSYAIGTDRHLCLRFRFPGRSVGSRPGRNFFSYLSGGLLFVCRFVRRYVKGCKMENGLAINRIPANTFQGNLGLNGTVIVLRACWTKTKLV